MSDALRAKCIVNTRATHQAHALNAVLSQQGAQVLEYPCIAIVLPPDTRALDSALRDLIGGAYDWLLLTSANTVFALAQRLTDLRLTLDAARFHTAAVGMSTAESAREYLHLREVLLPAEYIAEALAEALPVTPSSRVLLPESAIAPPTLADLLTARGAQVTVVEAYQNVTGTGGVDLAAALADGQVDALTFTSASTVAGLVERLQPHTGALDAARDVCAACIGPKTAVAAQAHGFRHVVSAHEYTLDGLMQILDEYFTRHSPHIMQGYSTDSDDRTGYDSR